MRTIEHAYTGPPFSVGTLSDYDIAIISEDLFANAIGRGVRQMGGLPARTDVLSSSQLAALRLGAFEQQARRAILEATGVAYPLNFKIYQNTLSGSPQIILP